MVRHYYPSYNYPSYNYSDYYSNYNTYQEPENSSISPIIIIVLIICCCSCLLGSSSLLPIIGLGVAISNSPDVYYYEDLSGGSGVQKNITVFNISGNKVTINTITYSGTLNDPKTVLTLDKIFNKPLTPQIVLDFVINKNNTVTFDGTKLEMNNSKITATMASSNPDIIGTWSDKNNTFIFNTDLTIKGVVNTTKLQYPYYFSPKNIYDSVGNHYSSYTLDTKKETITLKDVNITLTKKIG